LVVKEQEFFSWLGDEFLPSLPEFSWAEFGEPASVAVLVVDLVRGFCHMGPLASPRVEALVQPTAAFLQDAAARGVGHIWYCCDEHPPDSPEFHAFPPHCVAGTAESDLHPELAALGLGRRISKGSLNAMLETELPGLIEANPELRHFVLVGDCTDLCIYSAGMHLRMLANARGSDWQVWVVANLVNTYDLPIAVAKEIGAMPHPGELCHQFALYQMRLNGCRLVNYSSSISA
jgi:nicotinamidase-related amidase